MQAKNELLNRLLIITLLVIAGNALLTLAAQPSSFWHDPRTGIRFDGLPIGSPTNPMFDFFLSQGWLIYLVTAAIFGVLAWLVTTLLPSRFAMVVEVTLILGLCYTGSNWVVTRWHTGIAGAVSYVAALATALALAVMPTSESGSRRALKRLCWVMALTTAIDGIFTLIGQPAGYWQNPAIVHEANPASKYFLEHGWWSYAAYVVVAEIAAPWLVSLRVAPTTGWAIAFGMAIGGLYGASNWLFYEWRLGLQAVVVCGFLLSIVLVLLVFRSERA